MKFNLKTVLLIDVVVLALGFFTFLFGQQIGDFLHPSPSKAFYKEVNSDIDGLYADLDDDKLSEKGKLEERIDQIDQKTIKESNNLFQEELNGKEDSLSNMEEALASLNKNHIYSGDRSMLAIYLGSLIKAKAPAEWSYNKNSGYLFLKSTKNEESIDLYDYVENRILGDGPSANDFYKDSIKKLGGE